MSSDSDEEGSPWAGLLFGPALGLVATMALWSNEARFDYHRAARQARFLKDAAADVEGEPIGFTGPMDVELEFPGEYVESIRGYLHVARDAEIYAWDRDEDDDSVTWTLRWMSSVEGNSRNSGVRQRLRSKDLAPPEYRIGERIVDAQLTEFVDRRRPLDANALALSASGREFGLSPTGEYLYLRKGRSDQLGDERVSYNGVPVPATATYFGLLDRGRAVAFVAKERTGWIHGLIGDTGVLHHIVAGERTKALRTMKADLARRTWLVRGGGTVAMVFAFYAFFSGAFSILLHIPLIGRLAEIGLFLASIALGISLSLIVMLTSYAVHHPCILGVFVAGVAGFVYYYRRRGSAVQQEVRRSLVDEFGHEPSSRELVEREFLALVRLARADGDLDPDEAKVLRKWAVKRGLDADDVQRLRELAEADDESTTIESESELRLLVRMALADREVSAEEMKLLRRAAKHVGVDRKGLHDVFRDVRRSRPSRSAAAGA